MHLARRAWCRTYQTVFRIALPILPYTEPLILEHAEDVPAVLQKRSIQKVLIVTDPGIARLGLTAPLERALTAQGIGVTVYAETRANPTVSNVEEAASLYRESACQAIIGFGGGSVMDCAKGVGARIAQPNKPINKMRGLLRIHRRLPLLIAVPTTAGTGSEVTLAAVITDDETHYKYPINDFVLIPRFAVHDPEFTRGLPASITGQTGMDALTHAIEGYTTKAAWEMTDMFHLKAIELIARHLRGAVENTAEGREGMALAQYVAGMGFSNVGLGIVHSMAHGLGALYDTPHGVANAIILPVVMEYNAPYTGEKYREIARAMGVEGVDAMTQEEYRKAACDAVRKLGQDVGIPADLKAIVKDEDVQFLAESAFADACRPGNPRDTSVEEIAALYRSMM